MSLDVQYRVPDQNVEHMDVGFSTTEVVDKDTSGLIKPDGVLILENETEEHFVSSDDIYMYWVIGYSFPVSIALSPSGPLESDYSKLEWGLGWKSPTGGNEYIRIGEGVGYNRKEVFTKNYISTDYTIGSVKLDFTTESLEGKPAGVYGGTLQLLVSPL